MLEALIERFIKGCKRPLFRLVVKWLVFPIFKSFTLAYLLVIGVPLPIVKAVSQQAYPRNGVLFVKRAIWFTYYCAIPISQLRLKFFVISSGFGVNTFEHLTPYVKKIMPDSFDKSVTMASIYIKLLEFHCRRFGEIFLEKEKLASIWDEQFVSSINSALRYIRLELEADSSKSYVESDPQVVQQELEREDFEKAFF